MNIKCKVCSNLNYCPASDDPDTCVIFEIGMDKLIKTATKQNITGNILEIFDIVFIASNMLLQPVLSSLS